MADVQTTTAEVEQTATQAIAEAAAVAAGAGAAPTIDLNDPIIKAAVEKAKNDGFNAGRQNRDAELRKERGSDEAVKQFTQNLVKEVQMRLEAGKDLSDIGRDTPLIVKANREAVEIELFQRLYEQAKATDPDSVATLETFVNPEGLSVEQWQKLAQAAMEAVSTTARKNAMKEWMDSESLDDIDIGSKRYKAIEASLRKEMEKELNAREIENRKTLPQPPATPTGTAAAEPMTRARLDAMTSAERLNYLVGLSDEDRAKAWEMAATVA